MKQISPELLHVDFVPSNAKCYHEGTKLYMCQDSEAVIKMRMKGRSPNLRHVSRTHRVAVDWLFDRIILYPKNRIRYVDSKNQLADILTRGQFTRDEWNHLLCLFTIRLFSSRSCTEFNSQSLSEGLAKRQPQGDYDERVVAKSEASLKFCIEELYGAINDAIFDGIFKPGENRINRSRNDVCNANGETRFS